MKILKFGGTSIGSSEKMKQLLGIIDQSVKQIVVLSAIADSTNCLAQITQAYAANDVPEAARLMQHMRAQYKQYISDLFTDTTHRQQASVLLDEHFDRISAVASVHFTSTQEKTILAQGELLSTYLFHKYLQTIGVPSILLPALDFMKIDEHGNPILSAITEHLTHLVTQNPENKLFITQGYICRNALGDIDNLCRGGSDYTASLIGAAMHAEEVQIWTDIDGMHNSDPRIIKNTQSVPRLSFDEAAELAYFGAKVLHPQSVLPVRSCKIPIRLLNTMNPSAKGTLITADSERGAIKSIAAKDAIIAIRILSSRMLLAFGFLRKIFEIFEQYKTPIDMITTSEVAVSLTIDDKTHLDAITKALSALGSIEVATNQTIICIVGDFGAQQQHVAFKALASMKQIPIKMISYGGSNFNISLLIKTEDKVMALHSLHKDLFGCKPR